MLLFLSIKVFQENLENFSCTYFIFFFFSFKREIIAIIIFRD